MWETICDAQPGLCAVTSNSKICVQILQRAPLWSFRPETPPPPPDLGTLSIFSSDSRVPPPPRKLKFRQILALWVFSVLTLETNFCIPRGYHLVCDCKMTNYTSHLTVKPQRTCNTATTKRSLCLQQLTFENWPTQKRWRKLLCVTSKLEMYH